MTKFVAPLSSLRIYVKSHKHTQNYQRSNMNQTRENMRLVDFEKSRAVTTNRAKTLIKLANPKHHRKIVILRDNL